MDLILNKLNIEENFDNYLIGTLILLFLFEGGEDTAIVIILILLLLS